MEDSDKNKFDAFMTLAQYWASRHDARREFEWKVTFGWWGLLVLAIHYVPSHSLQKASRFEYFGISGLAVFVLLYSFVRFWLYPLWKANKEDKDKSFDAARSAEGVLAPIQSRRSTTFMQDWSMMFQIFTTVVLLLVLCLSARF